MRIIVLILIVFSLISCQSKIRQTTVEAEAQSFSNVEIKDFAKLMNRKNTIVLDVRTPEETALGKIKGAIEINIRDDNFAQKISKLDKEKTYLVYCRSGRRSTIASTTMAEYGFKKLYNLLGGYNAWSAEKE